MDPTTLQVLKPLFSAMFDELDHIRKLENSAIFAAVLSVFRVMIRVGSLLEYLSVTTANFPGSPCDFLINTSIVPRQLFTTFYSVPITHHPVSGPQLVYKDGTTLIWGCSSSPRSDDVTSKSGVLVSEEDLWELVCNLQIVSGYADQQNLILLSRH